MLMKSSSTSQPALDIAAVEHAIGKAEKAVLAAQKNDGHWVYELEVDVTIPAEYVLMTHYLGETPDPALEAKIGVYLRRTQNPDGGWPLYYKGEFDMSASIKAYFALKMIGDSLDAEHMVRARTLIRARGGIAGCNVFTRILLALYEILPWRAVPAMPVEVMLLPQWFPFHVSKISYWARTVLIPLLVLRALKPRARNPKGVRLDELFLTPAESIGLGSKAPHQSPFWFVFFRGVDALLRVSEPYFPKRWRQKAIDRANAFVRERLNGEDGLGAIFPAMVNTVEMLDALGVPESDSARATARRAIDKLLVIKADEAYCQPCVSPVWDTALMCHALLETGTPAAIAATERGLDWLLPLQILHTRGDWISRRPMVRPGGWAFQYANPHYPDVDDTAVVVLGMHRAAGLPPTQQQQRSDPQRFEHACARATEWVIGMQSSDGGWGAFEPENTHLYLNSIPFSDHGALLDPPTADVSARCLSMLVQLDPQQRDTLTHVATGTPLDTPAGRALAYLLAQQEPDGSWYGRWGMNYIYGTWSTLCALNIAGLPGWTDAETAPATPVQRAVNWLLSIQNDDGGWGESGASYALDYSGYQKAPSTASQTAWALLGLMAAGAIDHPAVARGIEYLLTEQNQDGGWDEPWFTATGFPRVFYLRYHGYAQYFPLWALARYRNLVQQGQQTPGFGL